MQCNYDAVAPFYDHLSRMVFGNALRKAQVFLLHEIPPKGRILIAGGGTGWILEEITKIHQSGLQITYVEISKKMARQAKKRNIAENKIQYLTAPIQDVSLEGPYDIIITPFLLDNFSEGTIKKVFHKLHYHLKAGGLWLYSDFKATEQSLAQQLLLKLMYFFFTSFCRLETSRLHDPSYLFRDHGFTSVLEQSFFRNFIYSAAYQKPDLL